MSKNFVLIVLMCVLYVLSAAMLFMALWIEKSPWMLIGAVSVFFATWTSMDLLVSESKENKRQPELILEQEVAAVD